MQVRRRRQQDTALPPRAVASRRSSATMAAVPIGIAREPHEDDAERRASDDRVVDAMRGGQAFDRDRARRRRRSAARASFTMVAGALTRRGARARARRRLPPRPTALTVRRPVLGAHAGRRRGICARRRAASFRTGRAAGGAATGARSPTASSGAIGDRRAPGRRGAARRPASRRACATPARPATSLNVALVMTARLPSDPHSSCDRS